MESLIPMSHRQEEHKNGSVRACTEFANITFGSFECALMAVLYYNSWLCNVNYKGHGYYLMYDHNSFAFWAGKELFSVCQYLLHAIYLIDIKLSN